MKRKAVETLICLMLSASMAAQPVTVLAESVTEAETETVQETEVVKADDFELTLPDKSMVTVENESGLEVSEAGFTWENETEAADADSDSDDPGVHAAVLTLKPADGTEHVFEEADLVGAKDFVLTESDSFLFLKYTAASGSEKILYENAGEITLDAAKPAFVVDDIYIRETPDSQGEILAVAKRGEAIDVLGGTPRWAKVRQEDVTGYLVRSYVTESEETAQQAVKANEAELAAQQAAAAAAAAAAASGGNGGGGGQNGRYEVRRERFDDCDGSGHGYYIIYYSDGTTEQVNF